MRYNPTTGQMEDDGMPEGSTAVTPFPDNDPTIPKASPDAAYGDRAFRHASSTLKPGEFFASGPATNGQVLTNSPSASAAMGVDLSVEQAKVAKAQARMAQDQITAIQNGAPAHDELVSTANELRKVVSENKPTDAVQQKPKTPYTQEGESDSSKLGRFKTALIDSSKELINIRDPQNAGALKALIQREGANTTTLKNFDKRMSEISAGIAKKAELEGMNYADRQSWIDAATADLPASWKKIGTEIALRNMPNRVGAIEVGMLQGDQESAKIKASEGARTKASVDQAQALAQANRDEAVKNYASAKELRDTGNRDLELSAVRSEMPNATKEDMDKYGEWLKTGDTASLTPEMSSLFQKIHAQYRDNAASEFFINSNGTASQRDITAAERLERQFNYKQAAKQVYVGDGVKTAELFSTAAKAPEGSSVRTTAQKVEQQAQEQGSIIGVSPASTKLLIYTQGVDQNTGFTMADKALGTKPGEKIPAGTATDGLTVSNYTKQAKTIIAEAIESGKTPDDPSVLENLSGLASGQKDKNSARLHLGEAINNAITDLYGAAKKEWDDKSLQYSKKLTGLAADAALQKLNSIIGQPPVVQSKMLSDFMRNISPTSLASLKLDLKPKNAAEREELAKKPYLFINALLGLMQSDSKKNPNEIAFYNQALQGGTDPQTYEEWAAKNRTLDMAAKQAMRTWAAGMAVEETHVASEFTTINKTLLGNFDELTKKGLSYSGDVSNPKSLVFFTNPSIKKAYDELPEKYREPFLGLVKGKNSRIYGSDFDNGNVGVSYVPANVLTASLNNDESWKSINGLRSEEPGGGTFTLYKSQAIDEQMKPVKTKSGKEEKKASVFPESVLTTKNVAMLSKETKFLYDLGYSLASADDKTNSLLGRKMMDAALDSAHLEEVGYLKQLSDKGIKDTQATFNELFIPGVFPSSNLNPADDLKLLENAVNDTSINPDDFEGIAILDRSASNALEVIERLEKSAEFGASPYDAEYIKRQKGLAQRIQDACSKVYSRTPPSAYLPKG